MPTFDDVFSFIRDIVSTTDKHFVMFEIGACDGYNTQMLYDLIHYVTDAIGIDFEYHAFEPFKDVLEQFRINVSTRKVKLNNKAIGNFDGVKPFWESHGPGYYGSSSIKEPLLCYKYWPEMTFTESIVEVVKLDTYFKEQNLSKIDFIWADVQGAEEDLILGMEECSKHIRYLFTEYCNEQLYKNEIGLDRILSYLPNWEALLDVENNVLLRNTDFKEKLN